MAKDRVQFVCRACGGVQARWMGKCPDCGAWDSLEKFIEPKVSAATSSLLGGGGFGWTVQGGDPSLAEQEGVASGPIVSEAKPLPEIEAQAISREATGIGEFDRVLGGGLVAGSVVLLGGDPGIGKSTLLLQAAGRLAHRDRRVLYVSSEESAYQVKLRAERLLASNPSESSPSLDALFVLAETNLARIIEQARRVRPGVLVLDSIQMVFRSDLPASPGSVTQLRRCAMELVTLAKTTGVTVILVGHVTKEGRIAGPKLLEHLVDTVLSFEGDRHHAHRMVRAIKNRFGNTMEVGLFEMTGAGLTEVAEGVLRRDPNEPAQPGSVVCPAMHGSRCLMVEIQALTAPGFPGSTRRKATGVDLNRVNLLIAVLEKHGRLRLSDQDVYVSAVGGLRVNEPAADLAAALAITGVATGQSLPGGAAVIGEIGLGGEIRPVSHLEARISESIRLGFHRLIIPKGSSMPAGAKKGVKVVPVRHILDAIRLLTRSDDEGAATGYGTKSSTMSSRKSGKSPES